MSFKKIENTFLSSANLSYVLSAYATIALIAYGSVLRFAGIFGLSAAFAFFAYCSFRPVLMWLRCGNPNKCIKQITRTVLETLYAIDIVKTRLNAVRIKSESTNEITILRVSNLPQDETSAVVNAVREILDPIENPRYILVRRQTWKNLRQTDYRKYVGDCDIVYTRNIEGRKLLLKAKGASYSSSFKREKSSLAKRI